MQNDDDKQQDDQADDSTAVLAKDDLDEGLHELMEEFNLDEDEARKVLKLQDEGESEEDAVSDTLNN
jgi:hypothetical protein